MAWDPIKDAKKWINRIKDSGNDAINAVRNTGNQAKNEVESLANHAKRDIENTANKAKHEVEGAAKQVKTQVGKLPELAEKAVEDAVTQIGRALSSEILKKAARELKEWRKEMGKLAESDPGLVEAINSLGFELSLSVVTLSYVRFYARSQKVLEVLETYSSKPPALRRRPIIIAVEALGPTSVNLGIQANFALGVGTEALGGGFKLKAIPLKLFSRLGDRALAGLGVPE